MKRYELSRRARHDLHHIWAYIASDSERRAQRMTERIVSLCERLAQNPFLGSDCSEHLPELRFFTVASYVIYYLPAAYGIDVVRVLHGAQDAGAELGG